MLILSVDPGKTGAIAAIEDGEILFVEDFRDGLPLGALIERGAILISIGDDSLFFTQIECIIEQPDYKQAEFLQKRKGRIKLNDIWTSGKYAGMIEQWLRDRGADNIEHVEPRTWQKLHKGLPIADIKERGEFLLKSQMCSNPLSLDNYKDICKVMKEGYSCENCRLKQHNIIGPRGGYNNNKGDAVLIGLWYEAQRRFER